MPTPIRNNKVGLPDPQGNGGHPTVATTEPSAMVRQMAAQNYALKNGGQMPSAMQGAPNSSIPPVATVAPMNVFAGGNQIIGKYSVPAKPQQDSTSAPTTDFTNMPKQSEFIPEGNGFANPEVGPVASPYMKDAAETTPQNVTNFEQIPIQKQATGWNPNGTARYDSLSAALNGMASQPRQPQFQADPTQKDGGFFNWVRSLTPKKRPGRHEGETDDEYDARHTRNMQMVATLADAIRHMGNIVNTSKGAPLQIFNDPNVMIEQGRQTRKAERQKQAKLDADVAQKQAEMTLKERAAEADRLYKQISLGYKDAADKRAAQAAIDNKKYKDDYFAWQRDNEAKRQKRQAEQDKQKQANWDKQFNETKRHHSVSESNARKGGGKGRSGGSGGKYWFEDKDGKMRYQPNKTMWEQEYYREYGKLPEGESSVSKSTKTVNYKTGQETTTTERMRGASVTSQAAAAQNAAKAARNAKGKSSGGKSSGSKPKSKNGYKNTKALGL